MKRTDGISSASLSWAAVALVVPLLIFAILRLMPRYDIALSSHLWHFLIVSLVAAVALGLALAVTMAARNLPDSRTYFLAMAFVTMAGIFLAHGLGTAPFLGGSTAQPSASSGYDSDDYGYGYDSSASQSTTNSDHGAHEEAGEYGSSSIVDARLAVVGLRRV